MAFGFAMREMPAIRFQPAVPLLTAGGSEGLSWTLSIADSEATAWADWFRYLAESGIPPQQRLPAYLWTWQVKAEVANLQSRARLKRVGLPQPKPGRHTLRDGRNMLN